MRIVDASIWGMSRGAFVWPVLLGMGLAVTGVFVARWLGGGTIGAGIAAVTGAFAPSVTTWLISWRRARTRLDEVRAPILLENGFAELLHPRRAVVDFVGRRSELADLVDWCEHSDQRVRLITGPGGVGKSRLAMRLCAELTGLGWTCETVREGAEATVLPTVREVTRGRLLLVVDYAETRIALQELLRQAGDDDGAALRVVLLARSAGEWWARLTDSGPDIRRLLKEAYEGGPLAAPVEDELSDAELVAAAVPQFASALGVPPPARVEFTLASGRAHILNLHAAALVAVVTAEPGAAVRVSTENVLGELLAHEGRYWQGNAARTSLLDGPGGLTTTALRRIVAAGALLGAESESETLELLERVPGAPATLAVATWLRDLYPPEDENHWLGSLGPDRVAELHTVTELAASPELVDALLSGLNDRQALRALTLLGRACDDVPEAGPFLERLLPHLEELVDRLSPDPDLLAAIASAIPYPSLSLAEANAAIVRRILAVLPGERSPERAAWQINLSAFTSQLGRSDEALSLIEEAVLAYRELAAADPEPFLPMLANALHNHGMLLVDVGRHSLALPPAEKAATVYMDLADADPGYNPYLAAALHNLGAILAGLDRPDEAANFIRGAAALYQDLAANDPGRYRPDFARALINLGNHLADLGDSGEAVSVAEQAVTILRSVAGADPDRYLLDFARALRNLADHRAALGDPGAALPAIEEAAAIHRELASAFPDRHSPEFAVCLLALGARYAENDRADDARAVAEEMVALHRDLAAADPHRYRPGLARALNILGLRLATLERPEAALPVVEEAVAIRRDLAAADPHRYRPGLANALNNLGNLLSELDDPAEALLVAEEAVAIYRDLTATDPARYRPDLARALTNNGARLAELDRPEEALQHLQEAVTVHRELAKSRPGVFGERLAWSLDGFGELLSTLGREGEARRVQEEADLLRHGSPDARDP
ncbi:MAG: tetratricopeptide repeat protein [Streptosporangiales bacterium]|nr:tetratricopeptide repeat protein [Streptosporangiales bacterium]